MKLRKLAYTLVGIAMSCTLFAGNSFAAETWAACTPAKIGPKGAIVRIQVTGCNIDPSAGNSGWMTLNTTGTDQMMATILTAMSLTKPVAIAFDGTKDAEGYNYATAVIFNNL
ncbi:MAG: hypothetical protein KJ804_20585 [Proteobacteria bacterium]|nr:hypothetical protein [Pseudomonadota bacterium]MBU1060706.1 hypothetical protein [Pseudomonadota bacterium]